MKLFVTSYGIGNSCGFACGAWMNLADFDGAADFQAAATAVCLDWCKRLGLDESEAEEVCFPDYDSEYLPKNWYSECLSACELDRLIWFATLSQDDQELAAAAESVGLLNGADGWSKAKAAYYGYHESDAAFAEFLAEESGDLAAIPDHIAYCIDFEYLFKSYYSQDFSGYNRHYFFMA